MALSQAGIGSAPAPIEARVAALAPMRTQHRLRIGRILVRPGQPVKAGDVLVQMDTAEIDADLAVARAKLTYTEVMAAWRQLRLLNDRARTDHALGRKAEDAAVDAARIVTVAERDRSELAQLDINLALEEKLVGDQLASADRLKAMRLERAALGKKVQAYEDAVVRARKSVTGAGQRLATWRENKPSTLEDARAAAGEVQRREIARLELLRLQHELRAPFDGRVQEVLGHEGELSADPAIPIVTLAEEDSRTAVAYLSQSKADRVRVGDRVKLLPRDLAGPAQTGRVHALSPGITEIPERFRHAPHLREHGRTVHIQLDSAAKLPGLACDAVFHRARGAEP
jgi:multidrug resistance efflux pump